MTDQMPAGPDDATEFHYRSGVAAGILAATDRDPERRHTTEAEAWNHAVQAKRPTFPRTGRERGDRAFWLGYLRGRRSWTRRLTLAYCRGWGDIIDGGISRGFTPGPELAEYRRGRVAARQSLARRGFAFRGLHIRVDDGLDPYTIEASTLHLARRKVEGILRAGTEGCSRHEIKVYEWAERVVDGAPYLRLVERYHFGQLIPTTAPGRDSEVATMYSTDVEHLDDYADAYAYEIRIDLNVADDPDLAYALCNAIDDALVDVLAREDLKLVSGEVYTF